MKKFLFICLSAVCIAFADPDFNDDCFVDLSDFAVFSVDWLNEDPNIINPDTDLNSDDIVDVNDLILLAADWLKDSVCNPVDANSV